MLAEGHKELKKRMIIYPTSTFKVHCGIFVFRVVCAIFCASVERRRRRKEGRRGVSAPGNSITYYYVFVQLSWDLTIMMLSVWYTFMIPYRLAFISTVERWSALWVIDGSTFSIFNIIFYIDLPINFCTAVKEGSFGEVQDNHRDIAVIYIQSWFLIDLVTCFPFETLTEESDGAEGANLAKSFKLVRLIKTLRILRATRVIKKILEFIQFNPNKLRLLGLLSMLVSLHRKQ
jgi:hypothetical protein